MSTIDNNWATSFFVTFARLQQFNSFTYFTHSFTYSTHSRNYCWKSWNSWKLKLKWNWNSIRKEWKMFHIYLPTQPVCLRWRDNNRVSLNKRATFVGRRNLKLLKHPTTRSCTFQIETDWEEAERLHNTTEQNRVENKEKNFSKFI